MFQKSKLGNLLATVGLVGAAIYAVKTHKKAPMFLALVAGFGLGGYIVGNSVTNFYSTTTS